jgi:hypothetical protein
MKVFLSYKYICGIAALILFCGCHRGFYKESSLNATSKDAKGNLILLGHCTKERLMETPFGVWFIKNYDDYTIDTAAAEKMRTLLVQKNVKIFMGTWCGDSRREVPRMFKILDYCGVPASRVELIMLSNADSTYKQDPAHDERGMDIHRVPDMIFMDGKKEIGRIVESPEVSLENDALKILGGQPYSPNYKAVACLIDRFKNAGISMVQDDLADLSGELSTLASGPGELNTYGYVLMAAGEMQKAKIVFFLNTILYPADANVYDSFGEYYLKTGNRSLARVNYKKVLAIEPGNENARKLIDQMR